jgi:DNA-binding phage protein
LYALLFQQYIVFIVLLFQAHMLLTAGKRECSPEFSYSKENAMDFTEQAMKEQEQAFLAIKDEFSRLNAQFDGLCKDAKLSAGELKKSLEEKRSPELEDALNQAKAAAAQAGRARAAQIEASRPDEKQGSGRRRPGVVRM